jgi:hypothetical protein
MLIGDSLISLENEAKHLGKACLRLAPAEKVWKKPFSVARGGHIHRRIGNGL